MQLNFTLTYQHSVTKHFRGGKVKVKFSLYFICSLEFFLALWWCGTFAWDNNARWRSWVLLLSGSSFQFCTILLITNLMLHDKMGQNFSLGKHILSYLVCFTKKRKMETSAALGSIVSNSQNSLWGNCHFWTKQIKGTHKSGLNLEPDSICWY